VTTVTPWAAAEIDVDRVLAELHRRFPTVPLWRGDFTGNWFALVRRSGSDRLIEAATPAELGQRLDAARVRESRPAPRADAEHSLLPATERPFPPPVLPAVPLPVRGRHCARRPWWRRLIGALIALEER
jgi:hypothetical protein